MSIFKEQISRKPDLYPWTQQFIEAAQNNLWTHREFNFASDVQDFRVKFDEIRREIIVKSLSTIGQLEISVKKYWVKLGDTLPHPSLYDLGFVLGYQEVVHGDAYERLLEVLGIEDSFDKILEFDIIKGRVQYLKKYLQPYSEEKRKQFIYSIILFTLFIENIALFSQFYTVMWFGKYDNVLKDTNKVVEYTSREEQLHFDVGAKLINTIRDEHPELFDEELNRKINEEVKSAINYESRIIDWIIGDYSREETVSGVTGKLSAETLKCFIENRMNDSLLKIGYKPLFEIDKELVKKTKWFDEQLWGTSKTDFFNSRPVEYAKRSQSFDESLLFD